MGKIWAVLKGGARVPDRFAEQGISSTCAYANFWPLTVYIRSNQYA
jgi:hypothetical protein